MSGGKPCQPVGRAVGIVLAPLARDGFQRLIAQAALGESARPGGGGLRIRTRPGGNDRESRAVLAFAGRQDNLEIGGVPWRVLRPTRSDGAVGLITFLPGCEA